MKKHFTIIAVFFLVINAIYAQNQENIPTYKVYKATSKIKIDGKADDKAWKKAKTQTFDHFYFTDGKREEQTTEFKMLWDEKYIYLQYNIEDKYINASETKRDGVPYLDDCAEIFFIPATTPENVHYSFEFNPNKAVSDLIYVNNFNNGSISVKEYNPELEVTIKVNGTINDNLDIDKGWTLEVAIPHKAFKGSTGRFPIKKGSQWRFLASRQIRDNEKVGRRVMSTLFPVENIKQKGIHQPETFGLLEFVD